MLVSFFTNCTIIAKLCAYHTIKINKVCKHWHNCLFPMHKFLTSFWDWIYSNLRWFWTYIGMLLILWVKYCSFIHCSSFYSFYCLSSWNICCHCLRNILNYLLIVRSFYAWRNPKFIVWWSQQIWAQNVKIVHQNTRYYIWNHWNTTSFKYAWIEFHTCMISKVLKQIIDQNFWNTACMKFNSNIFKTSRVPVISNIIASVLVHNFNIFMLKFVVTIKL